MKIIKPGIVNRVPHIVTLYWIIKIAATTLGETGADFFSMALNIGYANTILIFLFVFLLLLWIKLAVKRYNPIVYWSVFTSSAIAGTCISDFIDRTLGIGYTFGSVILIILLVLILFLWHKKEKSIAVEYIISGTAETFYWMAVMLKVK